MARPRSGTDDAVLQLLQASATPLTAYQVLAALKEEGVQSPPVVYRALDRLEKAGQIHRLERLNAYFACHGHHSGRATAVFAVCTSCKRVEEWNVEAVDPALAAAAAAMGFAIEGRTVEVRGLCAACQGLVDAAEPPACCAPSTTAEDAGGAVAGDPDAGHGHAEHEHAGHRHAGHDHGHDHDHDGHGHHNHLHDVKPRSGGLLKRQ